MRDLLFGDGGRPLYNDDLESLQDDFHYFVTALFQNVEPHVVTNVNLTARGGGLYDVSYGIVWLDGSLRRFNGASSISLPAEIVLGDMVVLDERTYQTGETKPVIQERATLIRPATSEVVSKIRLTADGVLRHEKAAEIRFRTIGDVQATASINLENYASSGRGRLGTIAYGWGLCDGQEGRADLRGQFIVGQHPDVADYDTIGKNGGVETVTLTTAQLPSHNHVDGTFTELLQKAGFGNNNTAAATDGTGNGNGGEPDIKQTRSMRSAGGGQAHENRPPFYVLAYRQWIGW